MSMRLQRVLETTITKLKCNSSASGWFSTPGDQSLDAVSGVIRPSYHHDSHEVFLKCGLVEDPRTMGLAQLLLGVNRLENLQHSTMIPRLICASSYAIWAWPGMKSAHRLNLEFF